MNVHSTYQHLYLSTKAIIKKDDTIAFYNEKAQLYLETDVLAMGLWASLLQVRDGMWFPRKEAPDNAALQPIAFVSKSLSSADTHV